MKRKILCIISILISAVAVAQKKDAAQKEYDALRYHNAIMLSLKQDTTHPLVMSRLANGYRLTKKYKEALHWYRRFMQTGRPVAADYFHYADVLANNGLYDSAAVAYTTYTELEKGPKIQIDYHAIAGLMKDSLGVSLYYLSLNTNYDEFSPAFFKDGLVFTSNRKPASITGKRFGWDAKPFTDLWFVKSRAKIRRLPVDSALYALMYKRFRKTYPGDTPPTPADSRTLGNYVYPFFRDRNRGNKAQTLSAYLNSGFHDGPASMNDAQTRIAYNSNNSREQKDSGTGIRKLMIYTARYDAQHGWSGRESFPFNNSNYSTGHPALTSSGDTMYFVSDKPGGFGGSDLYVSIRVNNIWSEPRNLGAVVNTASEERFPYVSRDGYLYFSSDGHTGLGGLDIFRVKLENGMPVGKVKNLGVPFNSNKDDFGILLNEDGMSGYLSSNRLFSDDIFAFTSSTPLVAEPRERGECVDVERTRITVVTPPNILRSLITRIRPKTISTRYVRREPVIQQPRVDTVVTTLPVTSSTPARPLKPQPVPFSDSIRLRAGDRFVLEDLLYDYKSALIRPDAAVILDRLIITLRKYPTLVIEISSHTDSRGSDAYNLVLSQQRAESVVAYLVKNGIEKSRVVAKGYGEKELLNNCGNGVPCSEEQHQRNRRTEVRVLRMR